MPYPIYTHKKKKRKSTFTILLLNLVLKFFKTKLSS